MGKIFASLGGLTNPGVLDPGTGQTSYFPSQGQAGQQMAKISAQQVQPATSTLPNSLDDNSAPQFNEPTPPTPPQMTRPSFAQAAGVGASTPGGANALSPALSKGGKLMALLSAGLQGALAGRASSEQALMESGGRRSGGAGMGFEAGYNLPFLRAYQQQQVQRGGLENQVLANQVQYAPLLQRLGIMKTSADISKTQAEAGKATAEA